MYHNEKDRHVSQRKKTATFHNEKTATFYNEKDRHVSQRKKTATFHNGAVLSENTN